MAVTLNRRAARVPLAVLGAFGYRAMPHTDAVIVGFGGTAAIMAKELTDAGLKVVAL
jgi:hypothetical protein